MPFKLYSGTNLDLNPFFLYLFPTVGIQAFIYDKRTSALCLALDNFMHRCCHFLLNSLQWLKILN